ncbi:MAG: hypothetical protein APR53_10150 [Methanoculleus sp. SDB]|nr:MAG: hypothetical protein APR53_10150 [Methanoculleus sp. SDB]
MTHTTDTSRITGQHTTTPRRGIRAALAGLAVLVCAAAVFAVPVAAAPYPDPSPADVWNEYVGHMVEKAPLALQRGYAIINRLECEGYDVSLLKSTYAHAKQHFIEGKFAFENGITTPADNPIFQCKADCVSLTGRIADCVGGSHAYTKGMIRACQYVFPSYAEFAAGL